MRSARSNIASRLASAAAQFAPADAPRGRAASNYVVIEPPWIPGRLQTTPVGPNPLVVYTLQRGAPYTLLLSLVTLTVLRFGHSTLSPSCTEEHARLSVSRRTNQKTLTN